MNEDHIPYPDSCLLNSAYAFAFSLTHLSPFSCVAHPAVTGGVVGDRLVIDGEGGGCVDGVVWWEADLFMTSVAYGAYSSHRCTFEQLRNYFNPPLERNTDVSLSLCISLSLSLNLS